MKGGYRMDRELEIAILMQDRATRREAERLLLKGTIIYDDPEEWIANLRDNDCLVDKNLSDALAGAYVPDVTPVAYGGHVYLVEYVY